MIDKEIIKEISNTIHDNEDRVQNKDFIDYIKDCVNDLFYNCESEREVEEKRFNALKVIEEFKVLINKY